MNKCSFLLLCILIVSGCCYYSTPDNNYTLSIRSRGERNELIIKSGKLKSRIKWNSYTIHEHNYSWIMDDGIYIAIKDKDSLVIMPGGKKTNKVIECEGDFSTVILSPKDTSFPYKNSELDSFFHNYMSAYKNPFFAEPLLYVKPDFILYKSSPDAIPVFLFEKGFLPINYARHSSLRYKLLDSYSDKNQYVGLYWNRHYTLLTLRDQQGEEDSLIWVGNLGYREWLLATKDSLFSVTLRSSMAIKHTGNKPFENLTMDFFYQKYGESIEKKFSNNPEYEEKERCIICINNKTINVSYF